MADSFDSQLLMSTMTDSLESTASLEDAAALSAGSSEPISLDRPPKRQLTAYNLFFQSERRKILDSLTSPLADKDEEAAAASKGKKRSSKKKKPHGKIGFADLARAISAKWKDTVDRDLYHELAEKDKQRYRSEMKQWKKLKREESQRAKKTSAEKKKQSKSLQPNNKKQQQQQQAEQKQAASVPTSMSSASPEGLSAAMTANPSLALSAGMANPFIPVTPALSATASPKGSGNDDISPKPQQEPSLMDLLQLPSEAELLNTLQDDSLLLFPPNSVWPLEDPQQQRLDSLFPALGSIRSTGLSPNENLLLANAIRAAQITPPTPPLTMAPAPAGDPVLPYTGFLQPQQQPQQQQPQPQQPAPQPTIVPSSSMTSLVAAAPRVAGLDSLAGLMGEECLSEFVSIFHEDSLTD